MYDFEHGDPGLFFSTAAGPDMQDLYGPPQGTLDVYADGSPMSAAESAVANSVGSGGAPLWARPGVHALLLLTVGAIMVHRHMEAE